MHVHDTESLMHALNDWRDHQKKIRRQLKLEERRERWKKQIEVRGRERRKEMLTKIGDSMAMLSPRQSMARGQPSLLQQHHNLDLFSSLCVLSCPLHVGLWCYAF